MLLVPFIQRPFSLVIDKITNLYAWRLLRPIVTLRVVTMVVIGAFAYGIVATSNVLPTGFIPGEDQGMIYAVLQTPPGSTLEYTNAKSQELERIAKEIKGIRSVTSIAGYEVLTEGRGSNAGTAIINLDDWSERAQTSSEIIEHLKEKTREMTNVKLEFFEPPAIPGFGAAGGIALRVLDQTQSSTPDYKQLGEINDRFIAALEKRKEVGSVFTFYASDYPQYEVVINNDVAMQKGVSIQDALNNLNILIGSTYEQGFVRFNQFYKVYVQAWPQFRRMPKDLDELFVKNEKGEMVPYSSFMELKKAQGLNEITRYNLFPSAAVQLVPAAGYSTGQAIEAVQQVAKRDLAARIWPGLGRPIVGRVAEGQRGTLHLPDCGGVRLPRAGCAVRELPDSSGCGPIAAGRHLRLFLVPVCLGIVERRLGSARDDHVSRALGQERDSDRGVCGAAPERGRLDQRRRYRGRKTPLPGHPDDLLRLYCRSPSAGRCPWRWRDCQSDHRGHGRRRHAPWHGARCARDPRSLLPIRSHFGWTRTPARRNACSFE